MSFAPSAVHSAQVTISHPQLRDLILPVRRGHVMYPHRSAIHEQRWDSWDRDSPEGSPGPGGEEAAKARQNVTTAREVFKLSFVPTCITSK